MSLPTLTEYTFEADTACETKIQDLGQTFSSIQNFRQIFLMATALYAVGLRLRNPATENVIVTPAVVKQKPCPKLDVQVAFQNASRQQATNQPVKTYKFWVKNNELPFLNSLEKASATKDTQEFLELAVDFLHSAAKIMDSNKQVWIADPDNDQNGIYRQAMHNLENRKTINFSGGAPNPFNGPLQ